MNKLFPFSTKLPEHIQNRITEVSKLLGCSQNHVVNEILEMGFNMIFSPDYGGFPRIVTIARAVLLEARTTRASGSKSPLDNGTSMMGETLPLWLKSKLQAVGLNGKQMRAIRRLTISESMMRREYEALTQTPPSTAKRQLAKLVKFGILVKKGKSRDSWYELVSEGKNPFQRK